MRASIGLVLVCVLSVWTAAAPSAHAQFDRDGLKCRGTLSKRALTLMSKAMKARTDCHRLRSAGTVPPGIDCNDLFQADPAQKLRALGNRLRADVAKMCATESSAAHGYLACPAPCRSVAPVIADFEDVADCVLCMIQEKTRTVSVNGQGLPVAPLDDSTLACHTAIGKTQSKLVAAVVKERRKCQTAAERDGATTVGACATTDSTGKIGKAESKGRASFRKLCRDADVSDLDSCSVFSLANAEACIFDTAVTQGDEVFRALYGLSGGLGYTTTTAPSSTTTLSTTTTTTLGDGGATCQITLRATTTELIGALRYEVDYTAAAGGFAGSGLSVTCTNLLAPAASANFFDSDAGTLRESIISLAGFNTPADLARCTFESDNPSVAAGDFGITVLDASTPDLQPANPTIVVGTVTCTPG